MSLLHRSFFDSVVCISVYDEYLTEFNAIGTGFCFLFCNERYIVTNKHVIGNLDKIYVMMNNSSILNKRYIKIDYLKNDEYTFKHPKTNVDIVCIKLRNSISSVNLEELSCIKIENILTREDMLKKSIFEGDEIFIVGHPINLGVNNKFFPISRIGSIARISNAYTSHANENSFLVDCFILPGNSGSPVFLKPNVLTYKGNEKNKKTYLIGISNAIIEYQTMYDTSMINTGLTNVIFADYIIETIRSEKDV